MRVTMRVAITGTRNGQPWPGAGGTIDVPEAEASDLIAAGLAVAAEKPVAQKATAPSGEKATAKRAARKATAPKPEER